MKTNYTINQKPSYISFICPACGATNELYVEYVNDKYENDSLSSIIIPVKVIGNIYENEELLNG